MPSPFAGMDPYLEGPAFWADFQQRFLNYWCEAIADALPDNYDARMDESVNLVQMTPEVVKLIYPDVAVSRGPRRTKRPTETQVGTMLMEPVTIPHEFLDEVRQSRIEILHRPDRSLVAVLEMLSPFNKMGTGFDQYRAKRTTILHQNVHLVELDLLVGGQRLPFAEPLPPAYYYALVSRAENRRNCDVYAWKLRQPLPTIPIPLRPPDPDIPTDLGQVFRTTFERGRYARSLTYGKAPAAPLSAGDARWAVSQSQSGKRNTDKKRRPAQVALFIPCISFLS